MRRLPVAVLAMILLVGCMHIPTSGPVEEVPVPSEPRGVEIAPEPPAPGMTPRQLVDGFLQAMTNPDEDYAVAKQYLTDEATDRWRPHTVSIYEGSIVDRGEQVLLEGATVGRLDIHGRHSTHSFALEHDFGLRQVDGQWRISRPPEGLLISRYLFERYYHSVVLYFMDRSGHQVVPDPVHLPERLVTPSRVLSTLLAGPSKRLGPVVTDAVPSGVVLGAGGASIDAQGVVTVDLRGLSDNLNDEGRRRMGAQLLWSLTSIPRVTGLVVTRNGLQFTLPGANAAGVLELSGQQGYQALSRASASDLYGISDGVAGRIVTNSFDRLQTRETEPVSDLAVSEDGSMIGLTDRGKGRVSVGEVRASPVFRTIALGNLRGLGFVQSTLWLMGDDAQGVARIVSIDRSGQVSQVAVELPPSAKLIDFAVSPTRTQMAMVLETGGRRRLGVARMMETTPLTVTAWEELGLIRSGAGPVPQILSVSWQGEIALAVLAGSGAQRTVYTVETDGAGLTDLGPVPTGLDEMTAQARLGGGPIAVRTTAKTAWRYEARTRWTRITGGIETIAYG